MTKVTIRKGGKIKKQIILPTELSLKKKSHVAHPITVWSSAKKNNIFDVLEEELNCIGTNLCTEKRRIHCEKEKMCEGCRPHCVNDEYALVGKNHFSAIRTDNEIPSPLLREMVDEKLKELFKRCRRYTLLVLED